MSTKMKTDAATNDETKKASTSEVTREDVVCYLRDHRDFFIHHPELVEALVIPHEAGGAVSLIEHQVELLRNRNKELEDGLHRFVAVAKENEKVSRGLHTLVLGIISADEFDEVLQAVCRLLQEGFPGIEIMLRLFDVLPDTQVKNCERMKDSLAESDLVQRLFSSRRRGVVFLTGRQIEDVFMQREKEKPIRSAVGLALQGQRRLGALFMGDADVDRFQSSKGTLLLGNLSEIISVKLHKFVTG